MPAKIPKIGRRFSVKPEHNPRTRDERDALAHVREFVGDDQEAPERQLYEQSWFVDTMYYAGQQYGVMDEFGRVRSARPGTRNYEFYTANLVLPYATRAVSKIASQNFQSTIAPKSSHVEDRDAAKLAMRVSSYVDDITDFGRKSRTALRMAAIHGSGFLKYWWDPEAGAPTRVYRDPDTGGVRTDLSEQEESLYDERGWYDDTYPGEIKCAPLSLFNVWWPWDAREGGIEDCLRIAHVYADLRETLEQRFDMDLGDAEAYEATRGSQRYEDAIAYIAGSGTFAESARPAHAEGSRLRVVELWEKPTRGWDRGRRILCVGNRVVKDGDNPYHAAGQHIPFAMMSWAELPGRFPGISLVSQLRSPQRARNRSRSLALSIERTHGFPITIIPSAAQIEVDRDLRSVPGIVLRVSNTRERPFVTSPPQLPPYIGENADRAQREMSTISGQESMSESKLPGQVRSGLAVQALQEEGNQILSEAAFNFAHLVRDAGRIKLGLVAHFYDDARVVRTVGPAGRAQVENFTGADLRGHTSITIAGEPGKIESASSYQSRVLQGLELGILNPQDPRDRLMMWKALEYRNSDELAEDKLRDEERFEGIVRKVLENPFFAYELRPWDDPYAAARVLERHLKSDEFDEMPQETQQRLAQLWQQSSAVIQERLAQQMQLAMLQRGSAGEKGTASQPRKAV